LGQEPGSWNRPGDSLLWYGGALMLCRMGFIEHIKAKNSMVKKSRSSGKSETKTIGEEETIAPGNELDIPSGEGGGLIDFYYFFNGVGILTGISFIIVSLLRYVFPVL
jgi:hypothetical protein